MYFEFDENGATGLTYIANLVEAIIVLFASFSRKDIRFVPWWNVRKVKR